MENQMKKLVNITKYWQQRLRLNDWKVNVALVKHGGIDEGAVGECETIVTRKVAYIKLLMPEVYDYQGKYDIEQTLVHELLHLHFAPFMLNRGDKGYLQQEQAIDLIADGLVGAKRDGISKSNN